MRILANLILLLLVSTITAQNYPGTRPEQLAPGVISKQSRHEFGSIISKGGDELCFGVNVGNGRNEILYSKLENGTWTDPVVIFTHPVYGYNDPMLSNDEQRLYYISDQPMSGVGDQKDIDIWYSERTKDGWSKPINAGPQINTDGEEYYISFTRLGAMYFASNTGTGRDDFHNHDIYKSDFVNGAFQEPQKLPNTINTKHYEADVYVAPDESYMIFCANRPEGLGAGDLYISFKDENDDWKTAVNMGEPVNTYGHELCPFVTPDGKYFLYTSNQDIYWVSTKIFDKYR